MALYFVPVFPDETADTVRTSALSWDDVRAWPVPLPLPTLVSTLKELPWPEGASAADKEHRFLNFKSAACKAKGNEAEAEFLELCSTRGWAPKHTAEAEAYDYMHHVDAMLKVSHEGECWVDVKCMRALRRGWAPQSEYMWVELHASGWLMGGKATCVAQQIAPRKFALFDRDALATYVRGAVNVTAPVVPYAEQSFLRVFVRETKGVAHNTRSVLSLVRTQDAFAAAGCGFLE